MKLTPQEQQTLDAYDKNAAMFVSTRSKKRDWWEEKAKFRHYLPKGKILDIGSAGGRDANDFIEMGYEYLGVDISEEMIKEAKRIFPKTTFLHKSVYELNFSEDFFDGFWATAILLHMPKTRIDEALKNIHNVVKNEGIGFISLKKGEGERFVEGDQYGLAYRRFFSFWQEDEFGAVLNRNNFKVLESYELDHSNKKWLAFFVKIKK